MIVGKLSRILSSLRDRTLAIKVLNRLSRVKYVPAPSVALDEYIADHYPGDGWMSLSSAARRAWVCFSPVFSNHKIRSIAYVGANVGTSALALNEAFSGLEFYLVEPVPEVFQTLLENTENRRNMHCLNEAAGAQESWCDMFVDSYSPASSLLPYEQMALREFPFLGEQATVRVHVRPLDDILRASGAGGVDFLLMDVQGYEDKVLQGAKRTLRSCQVVVSELSLCPLYIGSSTFDSVYQVLAGESFRLRHIINPMEGVNHQILQFDGVFVREQPERT